MERQRICRLGGWFLWGSMGALAAVIAVLLAAPVVATRSTDAGEVMLNLVRAGFVVMLAAFLLGMLCHLTEGLARRPGERKR